MWHFFISVMKMVLALLCLYFMVSIFFTTVLSIHVHSLGGRVQSLFQRKRAIWFSSFQFVLSMRAVFELVFLHWLWYMWEDLLLVPVSLSLLVFLVYKRWWRAHFNWVCTLILSLCLLWDNRSKTKAIETQTRLHKTHTDGTIHTSALMTEHSNIAHAVKHMGGQL